MKMEFNEKLQELRRQRGLTQEELAEILYVSRTAISKWESGRGYPNIDSLKAIARFFGVTIDELLSNDELFTIAEEDTKQKEKYYRRLVFGLLDLSIAMLFFLPFFGQRSNGVVQGISLLYLTDIAQYLKITYYVAVIGIIIIGILTLSLPNFGKISFPKLSLILNSASVVLFIISQQPYAAVFLLVILAIKVLMLIKWQ
jgi:transcriptional regulator with XRE-family HTH domain